MSSNSLPALLAKALARNAQANDSLYIALRRPDAKGASREYFEYLDPILKIANQAHKDTHAAYDAANAAAAPIIRDILAHNGVFPASAGLDALVSAMHSESFANLAQLGDAHFSGEIILALRSAWRAHHQLALHTSDFLELNDQVARHILACVTFGDVAKILEDELHVPDQTFYSAWSFWRSSREVPDPAIAPNGLCDAFQNITLS
ncbi:hypothetical protein MSAN_02044800 [Mycena sanguinolenta]|uniref:Uncharacterized protein n=1 Tax=Mycena sanguinolenta TaxID=230812 RepID=A0A8H7CMZ3_9AGAR|nr:hypothetical protein MSAN_02044800 [Mycena sanguinolenta]